MSTTIQSRPERDQYIYGRWIPGSGPSFYSINPATGKPLWHGKMATEDDVNAAFEAATQAFPAWAGLDIKKRITYLQTFAKLIEKEQKKAAMLIAEETGKPLWEATAEVQSVIAKIAISIKAYEERTSEKKHLFPEMTSHVRYKPHGVIAVIGPFNFPAHLSNGHIVPALLAGNTIIYKPSELTPKVAAFFLQAWHDCHLPPGVLNGIQGDASTATLLLKQAIQGVYFTGSYSTGVKIHRHFSDRPEVLLALEMGGNNPLVIDTLRDLKTAIYHTVISSFITAGQRCSCARRLILPDNPFGDRFLETLIKTTRQLRIGMFHEIPEPFMGPVIRYEHALGHLNAQQVLINMGGEALLPMTNLHPNTGFLSPGLIDMSNVTTPPDEEIFAPLLQVYRYTHFEEALTLANQTRYGLSAALLSEDASRYEHFYHHIRAGLIHWNRPTTGALSELPFGGIGYSGNHRPSAYFAADYCAYPIASLEQATLTMPAQPLPGIV